MDATETVPTWAVLRQRLADARRALLEAQARTHPALPEYQRRLQARIRALEALEAEWAQAGQQHAWCNDPRCPEHRRTPTHPRRACPAPRADEE